MPDVVYDAVRESDLWPEETILARHCRRVTALLEGLAQGHITFVFSDDAMVHVLNREWRGKDKATNVLSFPDGDADESGTVHLGDVIVAHETLEREAGELGISFEDHLTHLMLHGALHLLGYDHMDEAQAKVMESLETRLLGGIGIKDPYQDGARALD